MRIKILVLLLIAFGCESTNFVQPDFVLNSRGETIVYYFSPKLGHGTEQQPFYNKVTRIITKKLNKQPVFNRINHVNNFCFLKASVTPAEHSYIMQFSGNVLAANTFSGLKKIAKYEFELINARSAKECIDYVEASMQLCEWSGEKIEANSTLSALVKTELLEKHGKDRGVKLYDYRGQALGDFVKAATKKFYDKDEGFLERFFLPDKAWAKVDQELGSDDFNRASIGSNWTVGAGTWEMFSSINLRSTGTGGQQIIRWTADTWADDQYVEVEINEANAVSSTAGDIPDGGALLRSDSDGQNSYYCIVQNDNVTLSMRKRVANSDSEIANATISFTDDQVIRCEIEGTSITCYYNGTQEISTTDSAHSNGDAGIRIWRNRAAANAWSGGNRVDASTTTRRRVL